MTTRWAAILAAVTGQRVAIPPEVEPVIGYVLEHSGEIMAARQGELRFTLTPDGWRPSWTRADSLLKIPRG